MTGLGSDIFGEPVRVAGEQHGVGVFGFCEIPEVCEVVRGLPNPDMNTSLIDNYCDWDDAGREDIKQMCTAALAKAGGAKQPSGGSADAKTFQRQVNEKLKAGGYCPIEVDGDIGSGTCAAASVFGMYHPNCAGKSGGSLPPLLPNCGGRSGGGGGDGGDGDDYVPPPPGDVKKSSIVPWMLGGAAVAGVLLMSRKRRRRPNRRSNARIYRRVA